MRAHYLQHVPFEGLGSIERWLSAAAYDVTSTRFFESTSLPELNDIDLLIVMGGCLWARCAIKLIEPSLFGALSND